MQEFCNLLVFYYSKYKILLFRHFHKTNICKICFHAIYIDIVSNVLLE